MIAAAMSAPAVLFVRRPSWCDDATSMFGFGPVYRRSFNPSLVLCICRVCVRVELTYGVRGLAVVSGRDDG